MIKILINEEEVVCSNNITIREEMLTTSSTILRNCYPKSWENDKDYISRYYFPKDYSKCEIYDVYKVAPSKNLLNTNAGYQKGYLDSQGNFHQSNYYALFDQYIKVDLEEKYVFSTDYTMDHLYVATYDINKNFIDLYVENNKSENKTGKIKGNIAYIRVGFCDYDEQTEITDEIIEAAQCMVEIGNSRTTYEPYDDGTREDLIFCGVVKNTGNISLNPRQPHYVDLQILDFKTLLSEGETLNYVIADKTIKQAIEQVISSISGYGFVLGNINIQNENEKIGAYSTLDKTAYDVFQYFAEITQSRWTTRMIDENTVAIDFFDPFLEYDKKTIESTQEYYCQNKILDISFNYSTNDYRNKQIMTSEAVFGSIIQTESKIADGYTKIFTCENKIGTINSILVNGVSQTAITKNQQEQGYSGDFVYTPGENTFASMSILSAGSNVVIDYYPIVRGREIILNPAEVSRISSQINRIGTISRYENRNDTTNSLELAKIGQSYIKYKGSAEITLKVQSRLDLFNVGEIVSYDSLVDDLDKDYMVKSKEIDMYLANDEIIYTYELTSSFNSEQAINYFDNQRAKLTGNIGEGETIIRDIDIENTANIIFYDTEINEITMENPTSLDFALDGFII